MAITLYKIKKWTDMLLGKSIYHVLQDEGTEYSKNEVRGYYNNLTLKVLNSGITDNSVPQYYVENGEKMYFSIGIFQYGLGAYDLYLKNNDKDMLAKVIACADWAVENQNENGAWVTFAHENAEKPFSAMAQGEGISLLIRAYIATENPKYIECAKKAKDFMLISVENGGTTRYDNDRVYFYEFVYQPLVLNGFIFSLWGLWDYCVYTKDEDATKVLEATVNTLAEVVSEYDNGYWSKYDIEKRICSGFYHDLHIAQLNVMYEITGIETFKFYADKWSMYRKSFIKKKYAFVKKVIQKVFER